MVKLALILFPVMLSAQNLMPLPAKIVPGEGRLIVDGSFRVGITGRPGRNVRAGAERLIARLAAQTGLQFPRVVQLDAAGAALVIEVKGQPVRSAFGDESYALEITPKQALLTAPTSLGIVRGIETFLQLVEPFEKTYAAPALRIEDRPRFSWRGLLVDSARHWMPVETMRRTLDGMAAVKLNVLHWHLSDDQGFRVESRRYPKLTGLGSDGWFYTQEQILDLVNYADERGIRIVPEFDMPGHTTSFFVGYPELASAPGPYEIVRTFGIKDPCMDPTSEDVYTFLDRFIAEMASLFPDRYFHIGGDEVNGKQWNVNQKIQEFRKTHGMKDNHDLQAYFNKRLQSILAKHGKTMVGWDEILHPDLPKDIVVQSWRGQKSLGQAARAGFQAILSAGWYLDHILPASRHYAVEPLSQEAGELTAEDAGRILGGEACMWSEFVSPETIDSRVWPRTAAIAERLWSPRETADVASMYRRLEAVSRKLEFLGLTHQASRRVMLERLAGTDDIGPLETLAAVVEPVKFYQRGRGYTQQTPLNRLIDAARPESDEAREFLGLVDAFVRDRQAHAAAVRARLAEWRENDAALRPLLERSPMLAEALPLSQDLAAVAAAGLEALDMLSAGKRPAEGWRDRQTALVKAAGKPRAEVLIMIGPAVQKLIEAAAR